MTIPVGTPLPLDIHITVMPTYDDNDQYVGNCEINAVPHHITLFRVIGDDWEQDAAPGHHDRLDALQAFEADIATFTPIYVDDKTYLCVITPHSL